MEGRRRLRLLFSPFEAHEHLNWGFPFGLPSRPAVSWPTWAQAPADDQDLDRLAARRQRQAITRDLAYLQSLDPRLVANMGIEIAFANGMTPSVRMA
jgi:hypothetical protein